MSESRDTAKVLDRRFPKTFLAVPHAFHGLGAAVLSAVMPAACAPTTPNFEGRASVIDAATLEIHGQRIRLWGCDAPENRQLCNVDGRDERCSRIAGERLAERVADRVVSCVEQEVDRYGRSAASCRADDEDRGTWLVREGFAVRYARYAGQAYLIQELDARRAKRGIWRGDFDTPEDWRRAKRESCR